MTLTTVPKVQIWSQLGFLVVAGAKIGLDRWWPGSVAATVVSVAFLSYMPIWLGLKIRTGYRLRRPHWTRESWLRYMSFAVQPLAALALVLYLSSFDMSSSVLGAPQSATRVVWIVAIFAMMLFGVFGLLAAIDWLEKGEPSQQFTRTRWFQRRLSANASR